MLPLLGVAGVVAALVFAVAYPGLFEGERHDAADGGLASTPSTANPSATNPPNQSPKAIHSDRPPLTEVRLTKPPRPDMGYVGSAVCSECHEDVAEEYRQHPMGMSNFSIPAAAHNIENYDGSDCPIPGPRRYRVEKNAEGIFHHEILTGTDGNIIYDRAEKIDYVVGSGQQGRSYLTDHGGVMTQSPLTWFVGDAVWNLSPGYHTSRSDLWGRRIGESCLRCHVGLESTEEADSSRYHQPPHRESFISCERCHGPGERHVELNQTEETAAGIINPDDLEPRARDSVCYQCHLSAATVVPRYGCELRDFRPGQKLEDALLIFVQKASESEGQNRIASQAEQMEMSRCYQASNGAMGCTTCHDPHSRATVDERDMFYRAACVECHQGGEESCALPVAEQQASPAAGSCIHCHMPTAPAKRIGHVSLSDHRILRRPTFDAVEAELESNSPSKTKVPPIDELVIFAEAEESLPQRELDRAYGLLYAAESPRRGDPSLLERARRRFLPRGYENDRNDQEFEAALDQIGDDVPVLRELALVYTMQKRLDRAMACNLRALHLAPTDDKVLIGTVDGYARSGNPQKALDYLERLRKVNPYLARTYKNRARLLLAAGQPEAAREAAEESLERRPLNMRLRAFLIGLYERAGMTAESQRHRRTLEEIKKAMAVGP